MTNEAQTTDKTHTEIDEDTIPDASSVDPESLFLEHGVLEPCVDEDDLCLTDTARETWYDRMDELRNGERTDQLGAFFGVDPEGVTRSESDSPIHVKYEGRLVGKWESDAAILADLAGADILGEWIPNWEAYPLDVQSTVVGGLRAFADICPTCKGTIEISQNRVESCCRSYDAYAVSCNECDSRVLEIYETD